jgi:hypothetical protein
MIVGWSSFALLDSVLGGVPMSVDLGCYRLQRLGFTSQGARQALSGQMVLNGNDRQLLAALLQWVASSGSGAASEIQTIFEDNKRTVEIR